MKKIDLNKIQYRFWIDDIIHNSNRNNLLYAYRIIGLLNKPILLKSLQILFERNEILHSTIDSDEQNHIFWTVHEKYDLPYYEKLIDSNMDEKQIKEYIYSYANFIYQLKSEFPCKILLLEKNDNEHFIAFHFHHICMDGTSIPNFTKELSSIYNHLINNLSTTTSLNYAFDQFNIFYNSQQNKLNKENAILNITNYLGDTSLVSNISNIKETSKGNNSAYYFNLGSDIIHKCDSFCKENNTTLFRLFCSVWGITISTFTNQENIVIDHAINLRPKSLQHSIGNFINNLPVRINVSSDSTINNIIKQIEKEREEIKKYPYIDYSDLLPALQKQLHCSTLQTPNIAINYPSSTEQTALTFHDCKSTFFYEPVMDSAADLNLTISDDREGHCKIIYNGNIPVIYVEELAKTFKIILSQAISNPQQKIANYNLIFPEQKKEIHSFNQIHSKEIQVAFLDTLIGVFKQHKKKKAVVFQDSSITYNELDNLSDLIANEIERKISIHEQHHNCTVGLQIKRSIYMIPTIIGILKAGCIYVPIDTKNPKDRSAYIIEDANIQLIITDNNINYNIPSLSIPEIVKRNKSNTKDILYTNIQKDIAYIIYTSGTTGNPKGVPITFKALESMIQSIISKEAYDINSKKRILQMASINFDASVLEIFASLYTGATLVVTSEEESKDPDLLIKCIQKNSITTATIPPALLSVLPVADFQALDTLIFAGEATTNSTFERWRSKDRRLINAYGPTENTVCSTFCIKESETHPNDIGCPLPNVSCYIMNDHHQILPYGAIGELYIGGAQLTKGYINRPDLNAAKFVCNPFKDETNATEILYKTGDLVCLMPNRHIKFIGRKDTQLKINGFRIESQEIETILNTHNDIKQAVVIAKNNNGSKYLAAYIQANENKEIDKNELQQFLRNKLPHYMIPSVWFLCKEIPLTINGKIDTRRLDQYVISSTSNLSKTISKDLNIEEMILSNIAAEILGIPEIDITDNLFDLGLTSIQAILMVTNAQNMGIDISISNLYKEKTIQKVLYNKKSRLCFWANPYQEEKPLLLLICGFSNYDPVYHYITDELKSRFSILVIESYMQFFWNRQQCNIQSFIPILSKILSPILQGKNLWGMIGYCIGGDIALYLASHFKQNGIAHPKVFLLDAFAEKSKEYTYINIPDLDPAIVAEMNRLSQNMSQSIDTIFYDEDVCVFLAADFAPQFVNGLSEEDAQKSYQHFIQNDAKWKQVIPHCHVYRIPETDHWRFLIDPKALAFVKDLIIKDYLT